MLSLCWIKLWVLLVVLHTLSLVLEDMWINLYVVFFSSSYYPVLFSYWWLFLSFSFVINSLFVWMYVIVYLFSPWSWISFSVKEDRCKEHSGRHRMWSWFWPWFRRWYVMWLKITLYNIACLGLVHFRYSQVQVVQQYIRCLLRWPVVVYCKRNQEWQVNRVMRSTLVK